MSFRRIKANRSVEEIINKLESEIENHKRYAAAAEKSFEWAKKQGMEHHCSETYAHADREIVKKLQYMIQWIESEDVYVADE